MNRFLLHSSYCTSTTGTNFAVNESEVLLRTKGGKYIDAQATSARMRFNGYSPLEMEVVYRDTSRTEAELGPTPEGYERVLGSGFLLSDIEQPWLITIEHGIGMYNKIGTALAMCTKGSTTHQDMTQNKAGLL